MLDCHNTSILFSELIECTFATMLFGVITSKLHKMADANICLVRDERMIHTPVGVSTSNAWRTTMIKQAIKNAHNKIT